MVDIREIADAVKDELNATTFSQPVAAEMRFLPMLELKELKTLQVTVVPKEVAPFSESRNLKRNEYKIDIGVQQKTLNEEGTVTQNLTALLNEIVDFFRGFRFAQFDDTVCLKAEITAPFIPEHLHEKRSFTGVVTLTILSWVPSVFAPTPPLVEFLLATNTDDFLVTENDDFILVGT